MVLFITLYKVVLTFEFVNETLTVTHHYSNESYRAVIPRVRFIMLCKVVLTLTLWMKSLSLNTIQVKAVEQYCSVALVI